MADTLRIKKIKLNDGSVYAIFDEGSLRLNDNNVLITGNNIVDNMIIKGSLQITEIDDIPVDKSLEYVLTWDASIGHFINVPQQIYLVMIFMNYLWIIITFLH